MSVQFIIGFFGWLAYIAICILYNYIKIEKYKIKPRYLVSNVWRALFGLICLIIMTIDKGFDPAYLSSWIDVLPEIVYIWSSFYLFFDPGLSALRGKKWNYRGKSSGILDRSKIVVYWTLKIICLIGFVWSLKILI